MKWMLVCFAFVLTTVVAYRDSNQEEDELIARLARVLSRSSTEKRLLHEKAIRAEKQREFDEQLEELLENNVAEREFAERGRVQARELMPVDEQSIVDYHNKLRSGEGASNMKKLTWSSDLADMAAECAANCKFGHCHMGENIYAWSAFTDDTDSMIQSWFDEKKDYDYDSDSCSAVCGHYTQVVWADSSEVGCALYKCPSYDSGVGIWNDAAYFVCNYTPEGNSGGKPFKKGAECSDCDAGASCDNGLCA